MRGVRACNACMICGPEFVQLYADLNSWASRGRHSDPGHVLQRAARCPEGVQSREGWPEGAAHICDAVGLIHGNQAEVARCL